MDNVLLMHVGNPLQDLLHVARTGRLRVLKAVVHNTFKQFPACDATDRRTTVTADGYISLYTTRIYLQVL